MAKNKITFSDAIEKVMLANGYYASLRTIYKEFEKYRPYTGQTPGKTIQERVQRDGRFTRIGLGVYALTEYLSKLPSATPPKTTVEKRSYVHTKMQGMIIELGNMNGWDTYTPDKNKIFDNKRLGDITTLPNMPPFTYDRIVQSIRYVDAIWFNERGFPEKLFEVEDSTDFRSSLVKFSELQDFKTAFRLVAPFKRKAKYEREISKTAFRGITDQRRCHFLKYQDIEECYDAKLKEHRISNSIDL